jgi:hypothetical protein
MKEIPQSSESLSRREKAQQRQDFEQTSEYRNAQVLYNLTLLSGEYAGDEIIDRVLEHESITRIVVAGQGGSGKTTVEGQLAHTLLRKSSKPLEIIPVPYDKSYEFAQTLDQLGPRSGWDDDKFQAFSDLHYRVIRESTPSHPINKDGVRRVVLTDLVVVESLPSAPTALPSLTSEAAQEPEESFSTLFIGVVGDPRVQEKAIRLREYISKIDNDSVVDFLKENKVTIQSKIKDKSLLGERVKESMGKMGPKKLLRKARREMRIQAEKLLPEYPDTQFESIMLPREIRERLSPAQQREIRLTAFYMKKKMSEGLPASRALIVVNPYHRGEIVWYMD